jgi:hypothetical protein
MVNLVIIFLFLFCGALVFQHAEDWGLGPSLYFCFVTLTTIGFGDYTPQKTFVAAAQDKSISGIAMMGFTVAYCIFGKAVVELCRRP